MVHSRISSSSSSSSSSPHLLSSPCISSSPLLSLSLLLSSLLLLSSCLPYVNAAKYPAAIEVEGSSSRDSAYSTFLCKPDQPAQATATATPPASLDGTLRCVFRYHNSGGSHEEWIVQLNKSGKEWECSAGRPAPPSYLFFKYFSLQIKGGKEYLDYTAMSVSVLGPDGPLKESETYTIGKSGKVESAEGWGGNVDSVRVTVPEL